MDSLTDKVVLTINREMLPTHTVNSVIAAPAVSDDILGLGDVALNDVKECCDGAFVAWTLRQEYVTGFSADAPNKPMPFDMTACVIFSFSERRFIDLNRRALTPGTPHGSTTASQISSGSSVSLFQNVTRGISGRSCLFWHRTGS